MRLIVKRYIISQINNDRIYNLTLNGIVFPHFVQLYIRVMSAQGQESFDQLTGYLFALNI